MGSGMYSGTWQYGYIPAHGNYPSWYRGPMGAGWSAPPAAGSLSTCTCGAYSSVIPPEPCPIHDPEKAYWRRKLLQEFGGQTTTTTTTTTSAQTEVPKYVSPVVVKPLTHFISDEMSGHADVGLCGTQATRWARVAAWVDCEKCIEQMEKNDGVE